VHASALANHAEQFGAQALISALGVAVCPCRILG
jgi:hypothetical protein